MWFLLFVRLLTVMCEPFAFCYFHISEGCFEGWIFRAASIDTEGDFTTTLIKMTDSHLREFFAVGWALDAIVILTAAQAIPHLFDVGGDFCSCPIGVAIVGYNAAKSLYLLVFIFNRCFQPTITIMIQNDSALIISCFCFKCSFYNKGKIFVWSFRL